MTADDLPFLRGPLSPAFRRHRHVLEPGRHPYRAAEWSGALVVVESGPLDLECHAGGVRRFASGAVLHLDGLALRALRCPGPGPTVLVSLARRNPVSHRVIDLPERPYVGVRDTCTAETVHRVVDRVPEVLAALRDAGCAPQGPPFLRYHVVGPGAALDVEAGVPVADGSTLLIAPPAAPPAAFVPVADGTTPLAGPSGVRPGVLPAGRYAVSRYVGGPDGLEAATAALLERLAADALPPVRAAGGGLERWGCRTEHYLTDPRAEPDPGRYETEIAVLVEE